ncbi:Uncharacterised protein [Yersinia ruckeri]|uniref:hypothetical protein n=1 Tax=Yersinia ruckeri TaxID=29486 RepID=UPI000538DF2D|nr:hypothetical protein [Yersinia ruckeri]AUQ41081.1 type II restriction endonuclease [Yersinia ruckeri]EKN4182972.1 type II restriction endonuclease [Yersinia ruckeri]EKN4197359.1 type II restriction endonuclease [Yersinia ruckeri]EKN4204532.1 type II restriction endonuclease [Yersinia ruckeri]EKN4702176.1 type II restriction endonuclease [Yersinia ruckeri]
MTNSPIIFQSSCIKTLSAVEARPERSNQHEFNGVRELKYLLGTDGFSCNATFSVRGEGIRSTACVTWYDAREAHPTRSEYRLYFYSNPVMELAEEGDNIVIGFDTARMLHIVLIKRGTASFLEIGEGWRSE